MTPHTTVTGLCGMVKLFGKSVHGVVSKLRVRELVSGDSLSDR